ncbi:MAG: YhdH/YhfP family quinone oxidoreductase, partial [Mariniblastus sp.]
PNQFQGFVVHKGEESEGSENLTGISELKTEFLSGEVLIQTEFSAVNYKDALAASGNPGVVRTFPLIPGIDAAGVVLESSSSEFCVGDKVFVAHAKFGTAHHGGWAELVRVPAEWVHKLPKSKLAQSSELNSGEAGSQECNASETKNFTTREAVIWGTAGFTAAQSVEQLINHGVVPGSGPLVVTGATGGVGIFAIKLLAKLGYEVVASTGKLEKSDWLKRNGAAEVISRADLDDTSSSPLLKSRWTAAIDTVGGNTLATVLKSCQPHACVTACGMVAGSELFTSVFPFILRGTTLCGIDSANISRQTRTLLWQKIVDEWRMENVSELVTEISTAELPKAVSKILAGKVFGRTLVRF